MADEASPIVDDARADLTNRTLRLFDDVRIGQAALRVGDVVEGLTREERLVVLLFALQPTLAHVSRELQSDAIAALLATLQNEGLGAAVWLEVARRQGIGVTPNARTV